MTAIRTAMVIGGGIAGPVAALAMRKAGIEATVYESHPDGADDRGATLTLAPNGLNALSVVDADAAVRASGRPMPGMILGDARGNRFMTSGGLPGLPATMVVPRAALNRALHDLAVASGVPVARGKRFVGADERPEGVVARFADGTTATADILVGADGIRSTVRTLIDPAAPAPEPTGLIGFGGEAYGTGVTTEPGHMHFAFGPRAFLGYWTAPDGHVTWFSNLPRTEPASAAEVRATPASAWLEVLREAHADDDPGRELLAHTSAADLFVLGPTEIMPSVPNWSSARMVVIGDAAHAPSPSSGQGASLAAESAVELARCLRDLPDAPSAFAAYERLRRPRVEAIAAAAARTNDQKKDHAAAPPPPPGPEEMFGPVHRHVIAWDTKAGE